MRQGASQLPLGAVRGDDGSVVVPESRRADGTVRKAVRIRQGYVPQDEVAKYKPIGQRLREQQAKDKVSPAAMGKSADAVADQLDALTITPPVETEREQPSRPLERKNPAKPTAAAAPTKATSMKSLKSELSTVNRTLREIAKLEVFAEAAARGDDGARPLTEAQTRKVARKPQLELRREEIIEALNSGGATDDKAEEIKETKQSKTLRVIEL